MPDTLTAALIVFAAFVYIEGGSAQCALIERHDAAVHSDLAEDCTFRAYLAAGYFGARITRWAFILFWPAWIAAGWLNALIQRLRDH